MHSLYYRKDLFEKYNQTVPRTWDEYDAVAQFFHGLQEEIPTTNGTNTTTLLGSCVGRKPTCLDFGFFNLLVHSTTTQAGGTNKEFLFDPQNMDPLMGEAMAETLRHLENQIRYGAPDGKKRNYSVHSMPMILRSRILLLLLTFLFFLLVDRVDQ